MQKTSGSPELEDLCFDPDPAQRRIARDLYLAVADEPIVSPHGHVDARLFADENAAFGSPVDLLVIPDHYVFRMHYSQGVPLGALGIRRLDGGPVERDPRKIWQTFADHFYLFRGTPSGAWLSLEMREVFGIEQPFNSQSAQVIYDQLAEKLAAPEFRPRALFERFNIEVLCTTDAATDPLTFHQILRVSGWKGRILPTFRLDTVVNLLTPGWRKNVDALSEVSQINVQSYKTFIQALENRREFFKEQGAVATDYSPLVPYSEELPLAEVEAIFQRALHGAATIEDATRFAGHMLMEMARMSLEDGLVMQLHPGSYRNHNAPLFEAFGPDHGSDIPVAAEYTRNLRALLNKYGNDPRLTLILFTLDETTYTRELAPLAGHYPALRLGPPWWFHDSPNGMARYFDQVMETAGLYNTAGFNDDTRAFCSIPARHQVWRRCACNWLAGLVVRGLLNKDDALEMAKDCAVRLARRAYRLPEQ